MAFKTDPAYILSLHFQLFYDHGIFKISEKDKREEDVKPWNLCWIPALGWMMHHRFADFSGRLVTTSPRRPKGCPIRALKSHQRNSSLNLSPCSHWEELIFQVKHGNFKLTWWSLCRSLEHSYHTGVQPAWPCKPGPMGKPSGVGCSAQSSVCCPEQQSCHTPRIRFMCTLLVPHLLKPVPSHLGFSVSPLQSAPHAPKLLLNW